MSNVLMLSDLSQYYIFFIHSSMGIIQEIISNKTEMRD
jgi:isochorismate hydrolase